MTPCVPSHGAANGGRSSARGAEPIPTPTRSDQLEPRGPVQLARDQSSIVLDPVGYEFPDLVGSRWDDNWLVIAGAVSAPAGSWSFSEPCLTTDETRENSSWIQDGGGRGGRAGGRRVGLGDERPILHRAQLGAQCGRTIQPQRRYPPSLLAGDVPALAARR
ncbi:MAG: WapI family immunity protein [Acidimicrobiales bacterium]